MSQETILVIENDQLLCDVFVELLESEGFKVTSTRIGEEAEKKLQQGRWDAVLLDAESPVRNAPQLFQTYKQYVSLTAKGKKPVFIVILTYEDQEETALAEADAVFVKPHFTPGDLAVKLRECLQGRQK